LIGNNNKYDNLESLTKRTIQNSEFNRMINKSENEKLFSESSRDNSRDNMRNIRKFGTGDNHNLDLAAMEAIKKIKAKDNTRRRSCFQTPVFEHFAKPELRFHEMKKKGSNLSVIKEVRGKKIKKSLILITALLKKRKQRIILETNNPLILMETHQRDPIKTSIIKATIMIQKIEENLISS